VSRWEDKAANCKIKSASDSRRWQQYRTYWFIYAKTASREFKAQIIQARVPQSAQELPMPDKKCPLFVGNLYSLSHRVVIG
jgi:hypothetical protein